MGTKFKEINTLSFIGHIGPKTERVWKEVDEHHWLQGQIRPVLPTDRAAEFTGDDPDHSLHQKAGASGR